MKIGIAIAVFLLSFSSFATRAQTIQNLILGRWQKVAGKTEYLPVMKDKINMEDSDEVLNISRKQIHFTDTYLDRTVSHGSYKYKLSDSTIMDMQSFPKFVIKTISANELVMIQDILIVDPFNYGTILPGKIVHYKRYEIRHG